MIRRINLKILILFVAVLILFLISEKFPSRAETPAQIYAGISNSREIIQNINFNDIAQRPSNYWAKDAIYEAAALEAVKGYGDRNFRPDKTLSKEEAIALIYRMLGKEAEAQKAAERLDEVRSRNQKKDDAAALWADGYLQLAANEGVIKQSELQTALQRFQPKPGTKTRFVRADPAQRQEVAAWIAKAAKIQPVYGQQVIFNSFRDWGKSDPIKVPYIEAILQNKIMNGKTGGYFDPEGVVTREQMAQILKNMEDVVFPMRSWEKKSGYVEDIYQENQEKQVGGITNRVIVVRGDDGKLYNIISQTFQDELNQKSKEFSPGGDILQEKELIVYKNGKLGLGGTIQTNDKLQFIADNDNRIKFIKAYSGSVETEKVSAEIVGADSINNTVSILNKNGNVFTYKVRDNAEILNDGKEITISDIKQGRYADITIENNMISKLELRLADPGSEGKDITGIVEDNNPSLCYISLYDEKGANDADKLRVYNYRPEIIEVEKNHNKADIKDIQPGDTVHIILDEDGNVEKLSAADNYEAVYGKIINKQKEYILIENDSGIQTKFDVDNDIIVISQGKTVSYNQLKDGEYVRLLVQKTVGKLMVKEITTQTYAQDISNIYKAEFSRIDTTKGVLVLKHPEKLYKGKWERCEQVGFLDIKMDDNIRIYDGEKPIDIDKANRLYAGLYTYTAVKKGFGSQEIAQAVAFTDSSKKEILYNDSISSAPAGVGYIKLGGQSASLRFNEGTIVVKDGKLVTGRSLSANDTIYAAANRDINSGEIEAGVIMTVKKPDTNLLKIFRGKLQKINPNTDFTLETFSILEGLTWQYNGFPKTFSISYNTRITKDDGMANMRAFADTSDLVGKPVYVIADETEAVLISDAPYGAFNVRGEVEEKPEDSSNIKIRNASIYNKSSGEWQDKGAFELGVLENTIIIKNGEIISLDQIEKGDAVKLLKKDDTTAGDAYIIFIEK